MKKTAVVTALLEQDSFAVLVDVELCLKLQTFERIPPKQNAVEVALMKLRG